MYRWASCLLLVGLLLNQSHSLLANPLASPPGQPPSLQLVQHTPNWVADHRCPTAQGAALYNQVVTGDCLTKEGIAPLAGLVDAAELIVRGRVQAIHSFWRADQRIIESDVTIAVAYKLLGSPQQTVTIRTPGGYLAVEGIGMVSPHAATFAVDEEVIAFAYQHAGVWRTVGGATGKFLVVGDKVINADLALLQPFAGLAPTIVGLIQRRGLQSQLPSPWRHLTAVSASGTSQPVTAQRDHRKWAAPHAGAAFYLNLNTKQMGDENGDRNAFRQAILAAAASWSAVPGADFTLAYGGESNATTTGYNGVNEVLFMHKGAQERAAAAQVWYTADQTIVEADIWINEDYGWNATGTPDADEVDLQSALLHEFGHWLILGHSADDHTVMFSRLTTGTLKRELQPPDEQGIRVIYPR